MKKSIFAFFLILAASSASAADYSCKGKDQHNKSVSISFRPTTRSLEIVVSGNSFTDTLSRVKDSEGLAVYEDEQESGDDSGDFGFFMRLAIPREAADGRRALSQKFQVVYRYAFSGSHVALTEVDAELTCSKL